MPNSVKKKREAQSDTSWESDRLAPTVMEAKLVEPKSNFRIKNSRKLNKLTSEYIRPTDHDAITTDSPHQQAEQSTVSRQINNKLRESKSSLEMAMPIGKVNLEYIPEDATDMLSGTTKQSLGFKKSMKGKQNSKGELSEVRHIQKYNSVIDQSVFSTSSSPNIRQKKQYASVTDLSLQVQNAKVI